MKALELTLAVLLALGGVRSFLVWFGRPFESSALRDQVLYALHVTGRVGLWLAFAGFFAGYALLEEPGRFRWYIFVPIGLASLQLVTAMLLFRSSERPGQGPS